MKIQPQAAIGMRSSTLTKIVFFFTILIALIIVVQLLWLNKIYGFEQKQFTTNVIKVTRGILEDLELTETSQPLQKLIETPDRNSFLVKVNNIPPKDSLIVYLGIEMEDFDLFTDCRAAVFDSKTNNYLYNVYLPAAASHHALNKATDADTYSRNYSFIQLSFPYRDKYVLHEMTFWVVAAAALLLLLVALGASIFYLYRQKFLNELQNDFIRNITHEFQTPLTTLKLGLDMVSKPGILQKPDKLNKYTTIMQAQTDYLHQHIENLVKVIKTDKSGLTLKKEKVNPYQLIKNATAQLQFQLEEKDGVIELQSESGDTFIQADRNSLYVVLLNIISNAIKYAVKPKIIINAGLLNTQFFISVKDNGIGIEKKFINKLFRKFYRVPSGDLQNAKGLGLGLYFVHRIVEAHGGKVMVNSIPEIGTEFKIVLPVN